MLVLQIERTNDAPECVKNAVWYKIKKKYGKRHSGRGHPSLHLPLGAWRLNTRASSRLGVEWAHSPEMTKQIFTNLNFRPPVT